MGASLIQSSLVGGELSPALAARADLERYRQSLRNCRNFLVRPTGGALNRGGLLYEGPAGGRNRLIPFVVSDGTAYVLEFGDHYLRVWRNGQRVQFSSTAMKEWNADEIFSPGQLVTYLDGVTILAQVISKAAANLANTPPALGTSNAYWKAWDGGGFETWTPWGVDDLRALRYTQSADVLWIVHPDYQPWTLKRYAEGDWRLEGFQTIGGPFLDTNTDEAVTVYASATTGTVTLKASREIFEARHVGNLFYLESAGFGTPWEPEKAVTKGNVRRSDGKYYQALNTATTGSFRPQHREGSYSDGGVEWRYLHSGWGTVKITAVTDAKTATGVVQSRLPDDTVLAALPGSDVVAAAGGIDVGEVQVTVDATTIHGFTSGDKVIATISKGTKVLWSGTVEVTVVDPDTFRFQWPTRIYRSTAEQLQALKASLTGTFRRLSTASADSYVYGTHRWAHSAWSDEQGWPTAVTFHQQRLVFGGTYAQPGTVWGSATGVYSDFTRNIPLEEDDALEFLIASGRMDRVLGMASISDKLLVLTTGGEWLVSGADGGLLTATSIDVRVHGFRGSSGLQPLLCGDSVLFVQPKGQVVRDLGKDALDAYVGADLTVLASHLFEGHQIVEWAFQASPHPIAWAVREDGVLLGLTYMREQQVAAWHRHDTLGGLIESVCVVPGTDEDEVFLSVQRGGTSEDLVLGAGTLTVHCEGGTYGGHIDWQPIIAATTADAFVAGDVGKTIKALRTEGPGAGSYEYFTITQYVDARTGYCGEGYDFTSFSVSPWHFATVTAARTIERMASRRVRSVAEAEFLDSAVWAPRAYLSPESCYINGSNPHAGDVAVLYDLTLYTAITFSPSDVGRTLRCYTSSGQWTDFTIQALGSPTTTVLVGEGALPEGGWPTFVGFEWSDGLGRFNGLDHLEGDEVYAWLGGQQVGPKVVASGLVYLGETDAEEALVGLRITADLETLEPHFGDVQTIRDKRKTIANVRFLIQESHTIWAGKDVDHLFRTRSLPQDTPGSPVSVHTGLAEVQITNGWDNPGRVAIRHTEPSPLAVLAIIPEVTLGDA